MTFPHFPTVSPVRESTLSVLILAPVSCPLAPRTESYDTRIARHDLECGHLRQAVIKPMIWTWYKDEWLVTRKAATLFLCSTVVVLALTPAFLGKVDTNLMSTAARALWAVLGTLGPVCFFFLWFGMWRYWVRLDRSPAWTKRFWFLVLLFGFWWGSCVYCYLVYAPQVLRRTRIEA